MTRLRFILGFLLAVSAWAPLAEAQNVATLVVNAPKLILTAGETTQLRAGARDSQGRTVGGGVLQWTSSNPAVASVDGSGGLTARAIGVTNITVRSGLVTSPGLTLQVLPLRLEITPEKKDVLVGETIQFIATAFDMNEQPIETSPIAWSVTGPNGGSSRAAWIDSRGVLTANGASLITVHAALTFSGQSTVQLARFEEMLQLQIKAPVDYKLTRWLASDLLDRTFTIRPSYMSEINVNDAGQLAVIANLGGLSSALVLYQNAQFDILASTGVPGSRPATYISQLEAPPSINNAGQVVVRYGGQGEQGLLLASTAGVDLLPEGLSIGNLQRLSFFRVGRFSLNEAGTIVFLANFTIEGSRTLNTGLFRSVNGNVALIWSSSDPLPGSSPGYFLDSREFGQDNMGNVYFTVQTGASRAVYKIGERGVERIVGPGTVIGAHVVQTVNRLVLSPNGYLAVWAILQTGNQAVIRVRPRDSVSEILPVVNVGNLLDAGDSGEVFWHGDPGPVGGEQRGWGMWRWPATGAPIQVTAWGTPFDGGAFNWPRSGAITSKGELYAEISTATSDLLVVRPDMGRVLFREGTSVKAQVPLNFHGIVPGGASGPLHIFAGSANTSVVQAGPNELQPIWVPGDRPAGMTSYIASFAAKDPSGMLYLGVGNGIMRISANRIEPVLSFPIQFPIQQTGESLTITGSSTWYSGSLAFAANRNGSFVWNASAGTHTRLMLYERGQLTSLMAQGGPNQTNSPEGGRFSGISSGTWHQSTVAIDDNGRVFVNAFVTGGPSGLFLHENGRWRAAALFGSTTIAGETVIGASAIHAGADRFYAMLNLSGGGAIAEYDGQQWKVLVARSDVTPDGMDIAFFGSLLSANRRGAIAFLANGGRPRIVTRTPDGRLHVVYSALEQTASGDSLWPFAYTSLQFYDDGRVFIAGLDTLDRNTIYVAEPTF